MSDDNKSGNEDFVFDDYMDALDKSVNGAIFEEPESPAMFGDNKPQDGPKAKKDSEGNQAPADKKELENLKARYDASSEEARRLHSELEGYRRLDSYLPVVKAMQNDPGLIDHISTYVNGDAQPKSIKDQYGLGEDFVFDFDEAISDPNSKSAQVFYGTVDKIANQKVAAASKQISQKQEQEMAIRDFQSKHKLEGNEVNELVGWAKENPLRMEDIYYLKNREAREKQIAENAVKERANQGERMRGTPTSIASANGEQVERDPVDDIMKVMLQEFGPSGIFDQ